MWFLLIPALVLLVLATVVYFSFSTLSTPHEHTGRLSHLGLICSVVGTAAIGDKRFSLSVPRRVTRMDVIFMSDLVRIELPLITASQKKNADTLLKAFAELNGARLDAVDGNSKSKIVGYYNGPTDGLARVISCLYQEVFGVDENRPVAFEIDVHDYDNGVIHNAWEAQYRSTFDEDVEFPTAYAKADDLLKKRSGCLVILARALALPMVMVLLFYLIDINAAVLFILITSSLFLIRGVLRESWRYFVKFSGWNSFLVLAATASTLWFSDVEYFQLIPSANCLVFGAISLLGVFTGKSILHKTGESEGPLFFSPTENRIMCIAGVLVSIIGFWINEYLRSQGTLESWIWYYAYFRIELMLGYLILLIPVIISGASRQMERSTG